MRKNTCMEFLKILLLFAFREPAELWCALVCLAEARQRVGLPECSAPTVAASPLAERTHARGDGWNAALECHHCATPVSSVSGSAGSL